MNPTEGGHVMMAQRFLMVCCVAAGDIHRTGNL